MKIPHLPRSLPLPVLTQLAALFLLVLSVLWKGGKGLEATWLLIPVAVLCMAMSWRRPRHSDDVPRLVWLSGMLFIFWTIIAFIFSAARNYGLDEVIRDVSLFFILLWAARTRTDGDEGASKERQFLHSLALITLAACLIGFVVYTLQPVNRFVGTFFDVRFDTDYWPNAWAEYLLLAWPAVLWWALRARETWKAVLRFVLLGIVIGCLLLSYSRGAFLAFAGQVVLLWLLFIVQAVRRPDLRETWSEVFNIRRMSIMVLVASAVSVATFFSANLARSQFHPVQSVVEKVTFTADEGKSSINERSQFWSQAWTLSKQHPIFGWGPYSFRFVQPPMQEHVLATSDHPHNVFLKLAMERGWPAVFFFFVLIAGCLIPSIRRILSKKSWSQRDIQGVDLGPPEGETTLMVVAVIGVLAHNLIDFNLQFVGLALPLWWMLGFLASTPAPATAEAVHVPRREKASGRRRELLVIVLLCIVGVYEGGMLVLSSLGRHAEAKGEQVTALQWYHAARGEIFSRDLHLSRAGLLLGQGRSDEAQAALDEYAIHNREDARYWKIQAQAAIALEDFEQAIQSAERAYNRGKWNDIGTVLVLLDVAEKANKRETVDARREQIDALIDAYADAIVENAHFIALSGNVEAFAETIARLRVFYPERREEYDAIAARAAAAAATTREKFQSRPPGFLW